MISSRLQSTLPTHVLCKRSSWLYTTRGGLPPKLAEYAGKGPKIAKGMDIYSNKVETYYAPESGPSRESNRSTNSSPGYSQIKSVAMSMKSRNFIYRLLPEGDKDDNL